MLMRAYNFNPGIAFPSWLELLHGCSTRSTTTSPTQSSVSLLRKHSDQHFSLQISTRRANQDRWDCLPNSLFCCRGPPIWVTCDVFLTNLFLWSWPKAWRWKNQLLGHAADFPSASLNGLAVVPVLGYSSPWPERIAIWSTKSRFLCWLHTKTTTVAWIATRWSSIALDPCWTRCRSS